MNKSSFKKADAFIEHNGRDLQTVFTKIHMLQALNRKILAHLDANIAPYCQVANLVGGKLTLIAANGSVATQVRFQTNDIMKKFRLDSSLKHIIYLECKVRPPQSQLSSRLTTHTHKSMPALSPETAEIIHAITESIDDPKLREVMARIARRVKESGLPPK